MNPSSPTYFLFAMACGLFVHLVLKVAAFFGKHDEVGEYKVAIADVEKKVGGVVEDVLAMVFVHNLLLREKQEFDLGITHFINLFFSSVRFDSDVSISLNITRANPSRITNVRLIERIGGGARVRALHSSSSLTLSSREIEIASSRGSKSNSGWLDFYKYTRSLYREIAHGARLLDAVGNFV
ncbi:hypothetical protein Syun_026151 [Stephania yunnanensis]|uniref:Uncharacterized protein n=1 Tax=Stephania yunnanensis TaxID=152371 RepID=A0AAP0HWF5_9MAGN